MNRIAPLLEVEDLRVEFHSMEGKVRAVNGLSFRIAEKETLAILGESGSGKSVSAEAIMGILDESAARIPTGSIRFKGEDLLTLAPAARRRLSGEHISMVFQDALASLNPSRSVGSQIAEMFRIHRGMAKKEALRQAVELMDRVRIPSAAKRLHDYPYEFSGGMRQRVMIAIAVALDPDVLIADEPTTALDVTVQAQIMDLLSELQADSGMGLVLITHDLGVVAEVADRILVMYAGKAMEQGALKEVYRAPAHPYTLGLIASVPRLDLRKDRLTPIDGAPPSLTSIPPGCAFHPRCPFAIPLCHEEVPLPEPVPGYGLDRFSACHRTEDVLNRV